jgi:hypothetical protein
MCRAGTPMARKRHLARVSSPPNSRIRLTPVRTIAQPGCPNQPAHRTLHGHRFMVVISRIHPLGYLRNNERSKGMRRQPL